MRTMTGTLREMATIESLERDLFNDRSRRSAVEEANAALRVIVASSERTERQLRARVEAMEAERSGVCAWGESR